MNEIFVLGFGTMLAAILYTGFRYLPRENRQILAARPCHLKDGETWKGENLTWYGLLNAVAYVTAVSIVLVILAAYGIPLSGILVLCICVIGITTPSSRLVARIVEKKPNTATIGGASFVGILVTPWIVLLLDITMGRAMSFQMPVLVVLSALIVAYAFGEGLGRLACISFGCCYGKPVKDCPGWMQNLLTPYSIVYRGKTRKAVYEGRLEGIPLVPVQGITAVVYCFFGLTGLYLFLKGFCGSALILLLVVTQLWRYISEFFRKDYRGERKITPYQIMGIISIFYILAIVLLFPAHNPGTPDIVQGLIVLWNPLVLLFLEILGIGIFLYTGRSKVTGASISFYVNQDQI